jgi:hypothetical protein
MKLFAEVSRDLVVSEIVIFILTLPRLQDDLEDEALANALAQRYAEIEELKAEEQRLRKVCCLL